MIAVILKCWFWFWYGVSVVFCVLGIIFGIAASMGAWLTAFTGADFEIGVGFICLICLILFLVGGLFSHWQLIHWIIHIFKTAQMS
jgi:hypothetical protein